MSKDQTPAADRGSECNDPLGLDDAEVGGFCDVCGGGLRYGERHRRCGDAVMRAVAEERERWAGLLRAAGRVLQAYDDGYLQADSETLQGGIAVDELRKAWEAFMPAAIGKALRRPSPS